jgi:hypothetical protein
MAGWRRDRRSQPPKASLPVGSPFLTTFAFENPAIFPSGWSFGEALAWHIGGIAETGGCSETSHKL